MIQGILLIGVSVVLLWISRKSLRSPAEHGFYRFFAWEGIAIQIIANLPVWFDDPLSPPQIVSWCLLLVSIWPALGGYLTLRNQGGAVPHVPDRRGYAFENTTRLVTSGLYGFIRHPMYASLLFLVWGAFFKRITPEGILATAFASTFLFITAKVEEGENLRKFGAAYATYMERSGMFLPRLSRLLRR